MRFAHLALIIHDEETSKAFYEGVLGLRPLPRPDLGFAGLWYALEEGQELHLMLLNDPYRQAERPQHGGRDHHVALTSDDFDLIVDRIVQQSIPYTVSHSGRKAVFFRDPSGNAIELMPQGG